MVDRERSLSVPGMATGLGFVLTAGLHATGYSSVTAMAREASSDLGSLVPAMWLAFSADLTIVGLILVVAARRPSSLSKNVFAVAGFLPATAAGLQIAYLGFMTPTAILIALAIAAWVTAIRMRAT